MFYGMALLETKMFEIENIFIKKIFLMTAINYTFQYFWKA